MLSFKIKELEAKEISMSKSLWCILNARNDHNKTDID